MSQRWSGYQRHDADHYPTPAWVTEALIPYLPPGIMIWEPAAGEGKMVEALKKGGCIVYGTDLSEGFDFLTMPRVEATGVHAIVTNPPYTLATKFIEHALELMKPNGGMVAMLLRTDFGHAKTRQHLFGRCGAFSMKVELTKRVRWIEGSTGQPSFNHSWFVWDWIHSGPPTIYYAP